MVLAVVVASNGWTPSGGAKITQQLSALDGAEEEDVLIILNEPVTTAGYATSLDVRAPGFPDEITCDEE